MHSAMAAAGASVVSHVQMEASQEPSSRADTLPQFTATNDADTPGAASHPQTFTASGTPDATGQVVFQLGDLRLQIGGAKCRDTGGLLLRCAPATIMVERTAGKQSIPVPSLIFLNNTTTQPAYVAAYRGPFTEQDEPGGDLRYTAIVSDINGDGHDDLLLWTDVSGRLGAPAYSYYLFDPHTQQFVKSDKLQRATRGLTLSGITGNTLRFWSGDEGCKRIIARLAVHGMTPTRLVDKTFDSCK
ncbi:XAC2610-related protein [Xanthomonas sacchari]|uniref:XAC2610-related protein n=1 Tax=Xanthomonas sacchari TaxID=56458 RepID=UPI003B21825D